MTDFRSLHLGRSPGDPLVLPGPWDAASARVFAEAGFPALATPSAGVSAALGYADGDAPADEMFAAISRIVRAVEGFGVAVSADIEAGYGLPPDELAGRLLDTGAVGCNLEDSSGGVLNDAQQNADRLAAFRAAAGDGLFINARVDTYIRGAHDPAQTIDRGLRYLAAGADCVYPITAPPDHLPGLASGIGAPLNALFRPNGPSPQELGKLGATRITFGGGQHRQSMERLRQDANALKG
ncbi:isocitrate lyase/phosphoenolpyruvate mutase family protein [Streptomyces sp. NBC_01306]|uniref:isocitrate lyase/PEP mutase family protein n=1 Tax=Streptomyces sp. NBC_01306 TaxID=2903819 RepID=UPI0022526F00|nr:isocitrate lyase/phosphoenolpyruvate mutase family protein [Streptomyces sp. NBC_01306]MCX4724384.1 isocitrate lyase/phosphoenolpyruvate mutase family protein [Streptomyces sp. NBC_01306]